MHVSFRYANSRRQMFIVFCIFFLFVCMSECNFIRWTVYKVVSSGEKVIVLKGDVEVDQGEAEIGL